MTNEDLPLDSFPNDDIIVDEFLNEDENSYESLHVEVMEYLHLAKKHKSIRLKLIDLVKEMRQSIEVTCKMKSKLQRKNIPGPMSTHHSKHSPLHFTKKKAKYRKKRHSKKNMTLISTSDHQEK
jgi:hypothetical protein